MKSKKVVGIEDKARREFANMHTFGVIETNNGRVDLFDENVMRNHIESMYVAALFFKPSERLAAVLDTLSNLALDLRYSLRLAGKKYRPFLIVRSWACDPSVSLPNLQSISGTVDGSKIVFNELFLGCGQLYLGATSVPESVAGFKSMVTARLENRARITLHQEFGAARYFFPLCYITNIADYSNLKEYVHTITVLRKNIAGTPIALDVAGVYQGSLKNIMML